MKPLRRCLLLKTFCQKLLHDHSRVCLEEVTVFPCPKNIVMRTLPKQMAKPYPSPKFSPTTTPANIPKPKPKISLSFRYLMEKYLSRWLVLGLTFCSAGIVEIFPAQISPPISMPTITYIWVMKDQRNEIAL